MATKPTFVGEFSADCDVYNSGTTPKTSGSVAVQAGDILVAYAVDENGAFSAVTVSGGGLTWTPQVSIPTTRSGDWCTAYIWTAVASSTTSITVSFAGPGTWYFGGQVLIFRASDGLGAVNSANASSSSGSTLSLTTTQDNSAVVVITGDWNATSGTQTARTISGATWSLQSSYPGDGAHYGVAGGFYDDVGAAAAKTVGFSAPASQKYSIGAIEVKGTAGAAPQQLTGSAAASIWSVVAQTLVAGAVALAGAAASFAGVVPAQTLTPAPIALSGAAPSASWTVPAQSLSVGSVAMSGAAPAGMWTVPSQSLVPGSAALSGAAATSIWDVPAQALSVGGEAQALSGAAAMSTWAAPAQAVALGSVSLSGAAGASTWAVPSQSVALGTVALTGSPATAAWAVPAQDLLPGVVALSALSASSAWAVPGQALGGGETALDGDAALSVWGVPDQALAGGETRWVLCSSHALWVALHRSKQRNAG